MKLSDVFKAQPDAGKEREDKARVIRERMHEVIVSAKTCISLDQFRIFKRKYSELATHTVNYLIDLKEPDPVKYAFEVKENLVVLTTLKRLLELEHYAVMPDPMKAPDILDEEKK